MHRSRSSALATLLVLGMFTAPGAAQQKPVSFRYQLLPVGTTLRTVQKVKISLTDGTIRRAVISRMREIEVLEVANRAPRAIRVHYREAVVQSALRLVESGPDPVDGKKYVVRAAGESTQVTNTDNRPVDAREDEFVRLDMGRPDRIQTLSRFLDGKSLAAGQAPEDLDAFARALEPLLRAAGIRGHEKFMARLESLRSGPRGKVVSFSISFSGVTEFLPSNTVQLEGSLDVTAPGGNFRSLFLEGPLEIVVRAAGTFGERHVKRGVLTCSLKVLPPLDSAMAGLKRKHGPPSPIRASGGTRIVVTRGPAMLVRIDGDPVWRPIGGLSLEHVTNARDDVLRDRSTGLVYLRTDAGWYAAATLSEGAWKAALTVPESFARIPEDHPRAAVRTARISTEAVERGPLTVFLGSVPTAIVALDGPLSLTAIDGTSLFYATNTRDDLFLDLDERRDHVLARGQWYRAERLAGPWRTVVGRDLPVDFRKIPDGHPRARVRETIGATGKATGRNGKN